MDLHFNMAVMTWLADHRLGWLTGVMEAASYMGEVQGFILIGTLIYVAFDKALAVRLILLVALAMCLNHLLKNIIRNPRPFIREGSWQSRWAIHYGGTADLAREYSTPSGHAMAGASFYSYLFGRTHSRALRVIAVAAIVIIGASRPYLGVHYVEDILLGWIIGLGLGLIALRYGERITTAWNRRPFAARIAIAVAGSLALWVVTLALNRWQAGGEPRAFLGYAGTITGLIIARPLELAHVDFDPINGSPAIKIVRYVVAVAMAFATLEGLGKLFGLVADNYSLAGYALQYARYTLLAIVSLLGAPWIFVRLGLASRTIATGVCDD